MRFFNASLDEMRDGRRSVWSIASCAAHLPRGGAVGEWYGGELAISTEAAALWEQTHVLVQVNSKKTVKPRALPEGVRDGQRRRDLARTRAQQYRRKQASRGQKRAGEAETSWAE